MPSTIDVNFQSATPIGESLPRILLATFEAENTNVQMSGNLEGRGGVMALVEVAQERLVLCGHFGGFILLPTAHKGKLDRAPLIKRTGASKMVICSHRI